ncbi:hypothetical protein V2J94_41655 [Streptomyces sp. DSM 41524]|uniref:Uncharacterized protein n=1 Tax=Streptomyces asiaticus subsp. ignotus TaxID=3098222 RepID=A0ABU7QA50_9ACTN|nr:hypothetical protein [Streptomyces sp. DSM 41524]
MNAFDEVIERLTETGLKESLAQELVWEAQAADRAEVLAEAKREVVSWLLKKADEYRATGTRQREADAVSTMASKLDRGAVRLFLDEAGKVTRKGEITQPAASRQECSGCGCIDPGCDFCTKGVCTPLPVRWDRTILQPDEQGDDTIVCCLAEDGRPVALVLDDEHRQALGEELLTPLGDDARELLAEIRRRGRAITVSQAHRWLNTRSVPRAHVRALLRRLAEHGDLVVREERGRRTYVANEAGGEGR